MKKKLLASLLGLCVSGAVLSAPVVAVAAPGDPSSYRVQINKVDASGAQLTGAEFKIVQGSSENGSVVDEFTTTTDAYFAELAEGTYTLVETQAPAGYKLAEPQTFTVNKPAAWTDPTIGNIYKATSSYNVFTNSTWHYNVTYNVTTSSSINEVVYCVNSRNAAPAANVDYIKKDGSADTLLTAVRPNGAYHDGDVLRARLMSILYNGYPTNASGFKEQFNVTDNEFRAATQWAIWDTADDKRTTRFKKGRIKNAYNALMAYTQNVPENMETHMYQVESDMIGRYQSLIGSAFGEIAAPMEITVVNEKQTKVDVTFSKVAINSTDELPGASLEIRDNAGTLLEAWTSTDTPHIFALTPGEYTMHEDQAPLGYEVAEDITFRVTNDFAVEVKDGDNWVAADNATVQMKDELTPTKKGESSPAETTPAAPPTLPNTGGDKITLANTGVIAGGLVVAMLALLGTGALALRKSRTI